MSHLSAGAKVSRDSYPALQDTPHRLLAEMSDALARELLIDVFWSRMTSSPGIVLPDKDPAEVIQAIVSEFGRDVSSATLDDVVEALLTGRVALPQSVR